MLWRLKWKWCREHGATTIPFYVAAVLQGIPFIQGHFSDKSQFIKSMDELESRIEAELAV